MSPSIETTHDPVARGWSFLKCFVRNPREVGALCPSTRHLGDAMLIGLDLQRDDVVVEYGPGTGSLTEAIRRRSDQVGGLRYLGIEREAAFCSILQRRFPGFEFAHAQVEDVRSLLDARGLPAPKAIISGLPLIFLPTRRDILRTASAVLGGGGSFRTFTYLQSWIMPAARDVRQTMRKSFSTFGCSSVVWRNFPPALVLRGDKSD
ncbi:MAG: SAM-dependent methyltransferase [Planctomycetota bacterium]